MTLINVDFISYFPDLVLIKKIIQLVAKKKTENVKNYVDVFP
jgi:hypothetical protein